MNSSIHMKGIGHGKKIIFAAFFGVMLSVPMFASAASNLTLFPCSGSNPVAGQPADKTAAADRECTFGDLVEGAQAVANKVVQIGLLVAPLIFAYVGYIFLTSGGSPTARTKATKIGKNVVIGLAIMMGAWLAVNLVLSALLCKSVFSATGFPFDIQGGGGTGPGCAA